ncbi:hypothetical protein QYS48_13505 [Marivirga arenosa]|uniref:Tetratricopeptide repeat protein n=1 Tax=Marivirga arenosa TaxID=3059076 RepID=A0AA49GGT7_9BACT|nr:hypothetical protein [Marivirga sp. ABR2-2]WKK87616.2 hypothetical protein QYS48_13505 [Marivirga sp. ABR2-2]
MKMKRFTQVFLLLLTLSMFAFSFETKAQDEEDIKRAKFKYNRSVRYNDFQSAKNAMYDLMALQPDNASYLDSLALIYFKFNQYASAALASRDALSVNPNNQMMLQISAQSLNQLGALDQSLKAYQRLYNITDDAFVLYEVIQKQYALKKYDDAMLNIELLLGKPIVDGSEVYVNNSDGKEIQVPFKAVIFNMQGSIAKAKGDEESAKKYFNNALKLAPNYALAKENLNTGN